MFSELSDSGGECTSQSAVIESRVSGFSPAHWTIAFGNSNVNLKQSEIQSVVSLFNNLNVAVTGNGVTKVQQIAVKAEYCTDGNTKTANYKPAE